MEDYRCYLGYFTTLSLNVPKQGEINGYLLVLNEQPVQFFMISSVTLKTFAFSMEKTKWQLTQFMLSEKDIDNLNDLYAVSPRFAQRNTGLVSWTARHCSKLLSQSKSSLAEEILHKIKVINGVNNSTPQPCYLFSDDKTLLLLNLKDQRSPNKHVLAEIVENEKVSCPSPKKRMKFAGESSMKDLFREEVDTILDNIFANDPVMLNRMSSRSIAIPSKVERKLEKSVAASTRPDDLQSPPRCALKKHKHPLPQNRKPPKIKHESTGSQDSIKNPPPINHFNPYQNGSCITSSVLSSTSTSLIVDTASLPNTVTANITVVETSMIKTEKSDEHREDLKTNRRRTPFLHPRYRLLKISKKDSQPDETKPRVDMAGTVSAEDSRESRNFDTNAISAAKAPCATSINQSNSDMNDIDQSNRDDNDNDTSSLCNSFNETFNPHVVLNDCRSPYSQMEASPCNGNTDIQSPKTTYSKRKLLVLSETLQLLCEYTKRRERARRRSLKKLVKLRDELQQNYDESSSCIADRLNKLQLGKTNILRNDDDALSPTTTDKNTVVDPVIATYDLVNEQLVRRLNEIEQNVTKTSKRKLEFEKQKILQEYWRRVQRCNNCQRYGILHTCQQCRSVFYCNKKCQMEDWNEKHSNECEEKKKEINESKEINKNDVTCQNEEEL